MMRDRGSRTFTNMVILSAVYCVFVLFVFAYGAVDKILGG